MRRTLRALEALAEGPQTQADLARRLAVHRRTARRLLARLVDEGYAEPMQHGRHVAFGATARIAVLGRQVADALDLLAIGRRHLERLEAPGLAARFIAFPGGEGVVLGHVERPDESVAPAEPPLDRSAPLHATAAGKVFLSADTTLLDQVLNQDLLAFTGDTLVTRGDLLLDLATTRERGYAIEDGEFRVGLRVVAAGVTSYAGTVVAALGARPTADADVHGLGAAVRRAAAELSHEIGGTSQP